MHLLIIEDEPKTRHYLKKGLVEQGYTVDLAENGEEGLFMARELQYDLIILDVMLPCLDGWAVIREIRERSQTLPVLFLTARDEVGDRVKGLELGADDYLIKPFAFSELLARVRTLLRRTTSNVRDRVQIADLVIDLARQKVTRGDTKITLTRTEFRLLSLLARHSGDVFSRTQIAEHVWDMNRDYDSNVIDVAVRRLRKKIDDDFELKLIQSIRGVGYVLESQG